MIEKTKGVVAGVFITLEKGWWTRDMRAVAERMGTFQHSQSANEYPRLQRWHIGQLETMTLGKKYPFLPEMANPLSGKELAIKQPTFWDRRQR